MAFLNARLSPGIEIMLDQSRFRETLKGADLVITGEGRMDGQTVRNKAPMGVARAASGLRIPVIGLCGCIGPGAELVHDQGIQVVLPIVRGPGALEEAIASGKINMERMGGTVARFIKTCRGL
jgi:glycerate kinase